MLDSNLKSQLQTYLQNLRQPIRLIASLDDSAHSAEMRELLQDIVSLSNKVSLDETGTDKRKPSFVIAKQGETRGVCFAAIPMGHEFTSLVLALLWTGGHPPKVEADVIDAIKALDGDFNFEVYMSLSCHNCPDVVQAAAADAQAALAGHLHRARALAPQVAVCIQLAHAGRKASSAVPWAGGQLLSAAQGGWTPEGPSALPQLPQESPPRAMDAAAMARVRDAIELTLTPTTTDRRLGLARMQAAVEAVQGTDALLFINDHWQAALRAGAMATANPITVAPDTLAVTALELMERNPRQAISVLPVVDPAQPRQLLGLLRLHDLVQAGFTTSPAAERP